MSHVSDSNKRGINCPGGGGGADHKMYCVVVYGCKNATKLGNHGDYMRYKPLEIFPSRILLPPRENLLDPAVCRNFLKRKFEN